MLSSDPQSLPNLEELRINDAGIRASINSIAEEINQNQAIGTRGANQSGLEGVKQETATRSPTLLAWCSNVNNKISIADFATKQIYASFDGAKITTTGTSGFSNPLEVNVVIIFIGDNWTHVKEIPNTKPLASLNQNRSHSANMIVFDISKKDQVKEIYSLGKISGGIVKFCWLQPLIIIFFLLETGYGDLAFNTRRGILGAVSLSEKIDYQLFTIDANASTN